MSRMKSSKSLAGLRIDALTAGTPGTCGLHKDLHIIPLDSKHIESHECNCSPELWYISPLTKQKTWVHKGL